MITPFSQAARGLIPHRFDVQLRLLTPIECRVACVFTARGRGEGRRDCHSAAAPTSGWGAPSHRPPASEPVNITKIAKGPGALSARCVAAPGPQCSSASVPSWQDGRLPPGQRGGLGAWLAMEFQSSRRGPGWRAAPSPRAHAASSAGPCRSRNLTGRSRSLRAC